MLTKVVKGYMNQGMEQLEALVEPVEMDALVNERLTLAAFSQLAGTLGGYSFVKVVVHRPSGGIHFLNNARFPFHAYYIADRLLKIPRKELEERIDDFNRQFYLTPDRRFYLGILSLHHRGQEAGAGGSARGQRFFSLETVEIDNMDAPMVRDFYERVQRKLDPALPLLFKPASHLQERVVAGIEPSALPRVFSHELFASARFVALNSGKASGRLRAFRTDAEYRKALPTLEWHDIIAMHRVPDDIPRVSGIINAHHTTPLSHTNVLAAGWNVPNAIQLGIFERIEREHLNGEWVEYEVQMSGAEIGLRRLESRPAEIQRPAWTSQRIKLEEPETARTPIVELERLRMVDRVRYGTKAANLGELVHLLRNGSERLLGFYRIRRPPRQNLLPQLAGFLGLPEAAPGPDISRAASDFLKTRFQVPRGIAIPFSVQQAFLESSPRIQQNIGKLKMALELGAREIDSLCLSLQALIVSTRVPDKLREYIDSRIAEHLGGVSSFVVRSSSNAEDLEGFSAAGIYESINHCTTAENVFRSIKEVWASLVSPRSVRLRHEVGISLDDCYMGVIIQEEIPARLGGVMVTMNPMNRADFRNVYVNASSAAETPGEAGGPGRTAASGVHNVVTGSELPYQYLFNTVEGGGRTVSMGDAERDLGEEQREFLQGLAFAGRLLQSHFSPDYTFGAPVEVEWATGEAGAFILQLRPYSVR
ncbi:MAG: PEP/pyruvate-binding domain-containing protein [Oligoflexia bacterium]|nr:PEP/pyruvate-binding domain-containing protein [Oligoflexia bacterium]